MAKARNRKFSEGGDTKAERRGIKRGLKRGPMEDLPVSLKGASASDEISRPAPDFGKVKAPTPALSRPSEGSFGSAFAAARKAGDKAFTWKGKSYTTAMKGEGSSASAKPVTKPTAPSSVKPVAKATPMLTPRTSGIPMKPAAPSSGGKLLMKDRPAPSSGGKLLQQKDSFAKPAPKGKSLLDRWSDAATSKPGSRDEYFRSRIMQKTRGEAAEGKAKGGKIDGCAIRGKTRAKGVK